MKYTTEEVLALVARRRESLDNPREVVLAPYEETHNPREVVLAPYEETHNPREVVLAAARSSNRGFPVENAAFLSRPREVYKDKKIERQKDISRDDDEEMRENCAPLPDESTSSKQQTSKEINVGSIARFSGITAQHSKTDRGIKVMINFQTLEDAEFGAVVQATAELKRVDRIRELKPYEGDSEEFAKWFEETKQSIRELGKEERSCIAVGRVHERSKRAAWYTDVFVVAVIINDVVQELVVYYDMQEYHINMDQSMSAQQQLYFLSSGVYGVVKSKKKAPSLADAERVLF
jgi:hypothetical protein